MTALSSRIAVLYLVCVSANLCLAASPLVPGTGYKVDVVGDDFETPGWGFVHNFPKSSEEIDDQRRFPTGKATNDRWYEGIKRGQPDFLKVVPTPENGLPGSTMSLLMRTRDSGVPGVRSYKMEQDDLVVNGHTRMGGPVAVSYGPSCVVRVYMPPFDKWENRSGATFGFRTSLTTHAMRVDPQVREEIKKGKKRFGLFERQPKKEWGPDTYWPGMFVQFRSETDRRFNEDSAYFTIRGSQQGGDIRGPEITETGWWTLGISCTADGQVHYFVKKGIADLTAADHVTSQLPYGYKAEEFKTFFFNVCNQNDGSTWSTPWIIDDPSMYLASGQVVNQANQTRRGRR
ncbi:MAG: hypothetical protein KDB27_08470 [Planctomycetales bacterium]|nr:hypothetical protein [Planctomycetales bacterium]